MPGASRFDVLPVVKELRPDLPVFMISAHRDADTSATVMQRGVAEFLTEPVDFVRLKQVIAAVTADARGNR